MEEPIIVRLRRCSPGGSKLLTVPRHCKLVSGDYVKLVKIFCTTDPEKEQEEKPRSDADGI